MTSTLYVRPFSSASSVKCQHRYLLAAEGKGGSAKCRMTYNALRMIGNINLMLITSRAHD